MFRENRTKKLLWFTEQLCLLNKAGIDCAASLKILQESTNDKNLRLQIAGILSLIKQGQPLSEGLKNYPRLFDHFYIEMVRVGEKTGRLSEILLELQQFWAQRNQLRDHIYQALTYPCFIMIVMFLLTAGLCFSVIPQFDAIFKSLNTSLPWVTQILFTRVKMIESHLVIALVLSGAGGYFIFKLFQNFIAPIKKTAGSFRIPLFGSFYQSHLLTWFFKILGLSLKAGLSMQEAVSLLKKTFKNTPLFPLIMVMEYDLQKGESLKVMFDHKKYFPAFCRILVSLAEQTGNLEQRFIEISTVFQQKTEVKIKPFKVLLEPVIMLLMGLTVGGLVLAIYYPIFSMGQLIG